MKLLIFFKFNNTLGLYKATIADIFIIPNKILGSTLETQVLVSSTHI